MFYLTPQERKFIAVIMIVFIMGAAVQLLLRRDIAPVRWAKSVRQFQDQYQYGKGRPIANASRDWRCLGIEDRGLSPGERPFQSAGRSSRRRWSYSETFWTYQGAYRVMKHAQALLLVGFGFIIRHSHRAFFAFRVTFLVVGLIDFGFIFLFRPKIWPVYAGLFCLGAALIHVAHPPAMDIFQDWRGQLKQSFYHYLDAQEAGTMSAIVLGDRGQIPKEINMVFRHTGTGHILVIAGLHMAMMTAMVIFILKLIRIPRPWQVALGILLMFTYALLTGGSIPVMRAAFMASVILASMSVELESDALNSLCFAALVIIAHGRE